MTGSTSTGTLCEAAEEQARRDEAELDALASHVPTTPCPSALLDGTDRSPTPSPGCPSPTRAASASAADSSGSADTFTELFRCEPWFQQALYNSDYMDEEADTEDVGTDTEDEETREIGGAVTRPLSHELAYVPHMAGRARPDDAAVADRTMTCPPPVLPPCVEQRLWGSTGTCTHPDGRMETCVALCDPTLQAFVATPGTWRPVHEGGAWRCQQVRHDMLDDISRPPWILWLAGSASRPGGW